MTEHDFQRLKRLCDADYGFYILGVHSFFEASVGKQYRLKRLSFDHLVRTLKKRASFTQKEQNILERIVDQHSITNKVRHRFEESTAQEALAATTDLMQILASPHFPSTEASTKLGLIVNTFSEKGISLTRDQDVIIERQAEQPHEVADRIIAIKKELKPLGKQLNTFSNKLKSAKQAKASKPCEKNFKTYRDLRDQYNTILKEYTEKKEQISLLENQTSMFNERRVAIVQQASLDFQRFLLTLNEDQKSVLSAIDFNNDFYIYGGPGTGKSIVLIHAAHKIIDYVNNAADVRLVTFTRSLAKYNSYIHTLSHSSAGGVNISTIDDLLEEATFGKYAFTEDSTELHLSEHIKERFNQAKAEEISAEIRYNIWSTGIEEHDYLLKSASRNLPIPAQAIWKMQAEISEHIHEMNYFNRNHALRHLYIELTSGHLKYRTFDYILIDEAQDLNLIELKLLRLLCNQSLVFAGDTSQKIYGIDAMLRDAGIVITFANRRGLQSNMRNTKQIMEYAVSFYNRKVDPEYRLPAPNVSRRGPEPIIIRHKNHLVNHIPAQIRRQKEELGIPFEDMLIIYPTGCDLANLQDVLEKHKIPSHIVKENDFDFESTTGIRLTSFHSAKGLDFPVVFMYLPCQPSARFSVEENKDRIIANLYYVAMTRALHQLVIFVDSGKLPEF